MWLAHHASCQQKLCGERTSGAACEHNGTHHLTVFCPLTVSSTFFVALYEDCRGTFLFTDVTKKEQAGCLHKCSSFQCEANGRAETRSNTVEVNRGAAVVNRRWRLLTYFSFAPFFLPRPRQHVCSMCPFMWGDILHLYPERSQRRARYQ